MTRNGKIALGCGGAGCLGLILIVVLGVVLVVSGVVPAPGLYNANRNYNSNYNDNGNYNSNSNDNTNSNSDSDSSDSSSMSTDDRHKLFQAAAATQDHALTRRVWEKLGLLDSSGSPNDEYGPFMKEHIGWIFRNASFVQSINTPEKARAYVDEHLND